MKKYIINISFLFISVFFVSCGEEYLNLETKSRLNIESWYKTKEDFTLAMNSCYGPLMNYHNNYNNLLMGSFSDRILFETPNMDNFIIYPTGDMGNLYRDLYFGLYRTTKLIQELNDGDEIDNMSDEEKVFFEAQARTLRAMYYFKLVTVFDTPPFYNEESYEGDVQANVSNGKQIEFWDQIQKDLEFSIPVLPLKSEMASDDIGRTTKGMARALLGKAMLYKHFLYHTRFGDKGSAQDVADLTTGRDALADLIDSEEYDLQKAKEETFEDYTFAMLSNTAYVDLTTPSGNTYKAENNIESVWEVQYDDVYQQNPYLSGWMATSNLYTLWFSPHGQSFKNHEVHPALYHAFEDIVPGEDRAADAGFTKDPRMEATLYSSGDLMDFREDHDYYKGFSAAVNTKLRARALGLDDLLPSGELGFGLKKHFFPVRDEGAVDASPNNKRIIRFADVLLMYAEFEFLLGNTSGEGLNALNEVRDRAGLAPISELTADAIKHERDVEFAGEIKRWFDLIRWSFDASAWNHNWVDIFGDDRFIVGRNEFLPIPQGEIDINNGELKQNPGW